MGNGLKGLIAAACVVVIAAGGWYLYSEYQLRSVRAEREAGLERARAEILKFAEARPDEISKIRSYCEGLNQRNMTDPEKSEFREQIIRNCRYFGYL